MTRVMVLLHEDDCPGLACDAVWRVQGEYGLAESLLPALEAAWRQHPAEIIVFPAGDAGDELATRLAWRLNGEAFCQVQSLTAAGEVCRAVYGSAMVATLSTAARPLCLSLARGLPPLPLPPEGLTLTASSCPLSPPQRLSRAQNPLQGATRVLVLGGGAEGDGFTALAGELDAEVGYTRQRVMAGGCDEQRMIGISGQSVAPEVCFVAAASGAPAFLAGIRGSGLIVAINRDADAPLFAAADVGIVGDAQQVLAALAALR